MDLRKCRRILAWRTTPTRGRIGISSPVLERVSDRPSWNFPRPDSGEGTVRLRNVADTCRYIPAARAGLSAGEYYVVLHESPWQRTKHSGPGVVMPWPRQQARVHACRRSGVGSARSPSLGAEPELTAQLANDQAVRGMGQRGQGLVLGLGKVEKFPQLSQHMRVHALVCLQ